MMNVPNRIPQPPTRQRDTKTKFRSLRQRKAEANFYKRKSQAYLLGQKKQLPKSILFVEDVKIEDIWRYNTNKQEIGKPIGEQKQQIKPVTQFSNYSGTSELIEPCELNFKQEINPETKIGRKISLLMTECVFNIDELRNDRPLVQFLHHNEIPTHRITNSCDIGDAFSELNSSDLENMITPIVEERTNRTTCTRATFKKRAKRIKAKVPSHRVKPKVKQKQKKTAWFEQFQQNQTSKFNPSAAKTESKDTNNAMERLEQRLNQYDNYGTIAPAKIATKSNQPTTSTYISNPLFVQSILKAQQSSARQGRPRSSYCMSQVKNKTRFSRTRLLSSAVPVRPATAPTSKPVTKNRTNPFTLPADHEWIKHLVIHSKVSDELRQLNQQCLIPEVETVPSNKTDIKTTKPMLKIRINEHNTETQDIELVAEWDEQNCHVQRPQQKLKFNRTNNKKSDSVLSNCNPSGKTTAMSVTEKPSQEIENDNVEDALKSDMAYDTTEKDKTTNVIGNHKWIERIKHDKAKSNKANDNMEVVTTNYETIISTENGKTLLEKDSRHNKQQMDSQKDNVMDSYFLCRNESKFYESDSVPTVRHISQNPNGNISVWKFPNKFRNLSLAKNSTDLNQKGKGMRQKSGSNRINRLTPKTRRGLIQSTVTTNQTSCKNIPKSENESETKLQQSLEIKSEESICTKLLARYGLTAPESEDIVEIPSPSIKSQLIKESYMNKAAKRKPQVDTFVPSVLDIEEDERVHNEKVKQGVEKHIDIIQQTRWHLNHSRKSTIID